MPWSRKIPQAAERLGPCAMAAEPAHPEPVLRDGRGHSSERPAYRKKNKKQNKKTTKENKQTKVKKYLPRDMFLPWSQMRNPRSKAVHREGVRIKILYSEPAEPHSEDQVQF